MRKVKWTAAEIPDQTGRVVVITGASSGIGLEAAKALAAKNATVIIAVRSKQRGQTAIARIRQTCPEANLRLMLLDLAELQTVQQFAERFTGEFDRLDLLINNAGVMLPPYSKTKDGFELQMGTNHFGHFALTGWLLPLLLRTPKSRIVTVSSGAHRWGAIDFDDLHWERRRYKAWNAYCDSKIANLYFTYELARRLQEAGAGTLSVAAHPGWSATRLQRHTSLLSFLSRFFAQPASMGALPMLYAAVAPEVAGGDYFGPDGWQEWRGYPRKVDSNARSHDRETAARLWAVSEDLTGVSI